MVPPEPLLKLPAGVSCGRVIDITGPGSVRSVGFPAHLHNQNCAYVLRTPEGYGVEFRFPGLSLEIR